MADYTMTNEPALIDDTIDKVETLLQTTGTSTTGIMSQKAVTDALNNQAITVDAALSSTSTNPVQNKIIDTALNGKQASLTFDSVPTSGSTNPVTSGGIYTSLSGKQATLTFDTAPTESSTNPVTSGGLYTKFGTKADIVESATAGDFASLNSAGNIQDSTYSYDTFEKVANKQNSLDEDTTNTKYPTVSAIRGAIVNNLTSSSATDSMLSAAQGYELDQKINSVVNGAFAGGYWFGKTTTSFTVPNPTSTAQNYFDFTTNTPYTANADLQGWTAGTAITPQNGEEIEITSEFWDITDSGYPGRAIYNSATTSWVYSPRKSGGTIDNTTIKSRASDGAWAVASIPTFSATSTYAVGDVVIYNDALYQCKTAITTGAAWNADDWNALSSSSGGGVKNIVLTGTATLSATSWDSTAKTQSITITGLLTTDEVDNIFVWSTSASTRATQQQNSVLVTYDAITAAGTETFTCDGDVPTVDLNIKYRVYR